MFIQGDPNFNVNTDYLKIEFVPCIKEKSEDQCANFTTAIEALIKAQFIYAEFQFNQLNMNDQENAFSSIRSGLPLPLIRSNEN